MLNSFFSTWDEFDGGAWHDSKEWKRGRKILAAWHKRCAEGNRLAPVRLSNGELGCLHGVSRPSGGGRKPGKGNKNKSK